MKKPSFRLIRFPALILFFSLTSSSASAQSGGNYRLEQTVVATGGGAASSNAGGSVYKIEGTVGQPFAGTTSGGNFIVQSGFWNSETLTPTAAGVSISGRILTPGNGGLLNARVTITDSAGQSRTVMTGAGGSFRFDDVAAGATYVLSVVSKRYAYAPQIITANADLTDVNFVPINQSEPPAVAGD